MKKINLIGRYAILLIAFVFVISSVTASAQTKRNEQGIDKMRSSDGNFEIWAEQWSNDADDGGFKNCRIKVFIKNITSEPIAGWNFKAKASRKSKPEGYEDIDRNHGRLGAGSTDEIVFQDYCYMRKDSIRVTKTK